MLEAWPLVVSAPALRYELATDVLLAAATSLMYVKGRLMRVMSKSQWIVHVYETFFL